MNSTRKLSIVSATLLGTLMGMLGQVAPAAAATCAEAVASPKAIVLVLLDRSGSMFDPGACADGSTAERKWLCALKDSKTWISDNDEPKERVYYIWQFRSPVADRSTTLAKWEGATSRGYCRDDAAAMLSETFTGFEGPFSHDADTPLAGAYCDAVDALINTYAKKSGVARGIPLYIKLESDGIENWTDAAHLCHGDDTTAAFTSHMPPLVDATVTPATVDGIPVTSWAAKMYDKAITGANHTYPPLDPAAFGPTSGPDSNLPIITNVTFIDDFIASTAMNKQSSTPSVAFASPFFGSAAVNAQYASLALTTDPTIEALVGFYAGLSQSTNARMTRVGSGAPVVGGTVGSYHVIRGDADDNGCVNSADFNIVQAAYGQKALPTNPNAIRADLNADGRVGGDDYLLLKKQYGVGCATNPGTVPVLGNALFGFDDPTRWSSTNAPIAITSYKHTEGAFALRVDGSGYREIKSIAFSTSLFKGVTSKFALDVMRPATPPNPTWGQVLLFVNAPSAKINNLPLGTVELAGKPLGAFSTIQFAIPANVKTAMTTARSDFSIKVVVNAADPGYEIDNLRFVP